MIDHSVYHGARLKWQDPEKILTEIGLKPGDTFVDIGCGDGFFAIPAVRIVGEKGRVYGLDNSRSALNRLEERAVTLGLTNLSINFGQAEDAVLCEGCADFVFFGIVLHDFDDREKVLSNAKRMLKPQGKLIDLDFKKEPMPFGPPLAIKLSEQEASELIEKVGFKVEAVKTVEPFSYLIIAGLKLNPCTVFKSKVEKQRAREYISVIARNGSDEAISKQILSLQSRFLISD